MYHYFDIMVRNLSGHLSIKSDSGRVNGHLKHSQLLNKSQGRRGEKRVGNSNASSANLHRFRYNYTVRPPVRDYPNTTIQRSLKADSR